MYNTNTRQGYAIAKCCCLVIAAGLLAYTGFRAYHLSFTHDESLSYNGSVHDSFMQIISNNTSYVSANNHILNTLLMKLFEALFGPGEFPLRIQSLTAHALYLLYTFLILKQFRNNIVILCGFILLNINPYLLDFFSLARGYALAIAFTTISMYHLHIFLTTQKQIKLYYSIAAACCAVLSNFALLNYFISLIIIYQFYVVYTYPFNFKLLLQKNIPTLLASVIMTIILYEPIRILKQHDQLYVGGETGFWQDTAGSLINTFLYSQAYYSVVYTILQVIIAVLFISAILMLIGQFFINRQKEMNSPLFLFTTILLLIVVSVITQYYVLGTKFLQERYALFIVPVYMFVVVCVFARLVELGNSIKGYSVLIILTLSFCCHFYRSGNIGYTYNWKYDADTKNMLVDLKKSIVPGDGGKVNLGITWYHEPAINYYITTKKLYWLEKVTRPWLRNKYDAYYVNRADNSYSLVSNNNVVKVYTVSNNVLLK